MRPFQVKALHQEFGEFEFLALCSDKLGLVAEVLESFGVACAAPRQLPHRVNFAIAIDTAKPIIDQLRQNGRVVRGYLGVGVTTVTPPIAAQLGLERAKGVALGSVAPGSPAALAGLRPGDVLTGLNEVAIDDVEDLQRALTDRFRPGDTVTARIIRGGRELSVPIRLGERPA